MPSFDVVNRVDPQEVDNAVNNTKKMIAQRYDFRGSKSEVSLNKKEMTIHILADDNMKMKAIEDELSLNFVKRKINSKALRPGETEPAAGGLVKKDIKIVVGIDTDTAKDIVKRIKGLKLKVQAQIQEDQVRVTGKKIDDLQTVIGFLKEEKLPVPLQYVNMKS